MREKASEYCDVCVWDIQNSYTLLCCVYPYMLWEVIMVGFTVGKQFLESMRSVRKVSDLIFVVQKPGGFQWSTLAWGDLEPTYACLNFFRVCQ